MEKIGRYDVFELSVASAVNFENHFTEAALSVRLKGPEARDVALDGFHAGDGEWRARFVPDVVGGWVWEAELTSQSKSVSTVEASGSFECVESDRRGFVRISKANPYRFEYDDGTPFYPIGQQTGAGVGPTPPFDAPDASQWCSTDRETFLEAFDGATNLIRSQLGCGTTAGVAKDIIPKGADDTDSYDLENCRWIDDSCLAIKSRGWAQIMIPFQDMSTHGEDMTSFGSTHDMDDYKTLSSPHLASMERYLRYVVARWSAYTDIWEIYNEDSFCPDDLLARFASVIREADPYCHPITTNYERPGAEWCEIVCPHEYMERPASFVPGHMSCQIGRMKGHGKPVLYTEFGNKAILSNDDPIKWRAAAWTAFMMEGAMTYWNMSGRRTEPDHEKPWSNSNCYLGAETRKHFRVLADFTADLPVTMRPLAHYTAGRASVEAWCLAEEGLAVVYLHNGMPGSSYDKPAPVDKLPLMIGGGTWRITWIDPSTGDCAGEAEQTTEQQFLWLETPPVAVDMAARLERL